jgi:colanic acid biosynthesis glycosyl transferase WcaI
LSVCLLCPFDLGRPSGTPLRAVATLEALDGHVPLHVLATSDANGAEPLGDIWSRDGLHLSMRRFCLAAFQRLRRLRPRVVHCFTPTAAVPAIAARRLWPETRVVLDYHGAAEFELARARPYVRVLFTALDGWAVRRADAVVAMSAPQRAYLEARWKPAATPEVSWAPVDLERVRSTPVRPAEVRRIGYFGNANFWQGLDDLVSAARLCKEEPLSVVVAGADASELGLLPGDPVDVSGSPSREQMLGGMEECDILVSPRRGGAVSDLQYPFKLSAYLAAGRPIIGTDVSDQGDIIRRAGCGLVVPPESPAALAEAMRELARAPTERLVEMGTRARQFAEHHLGFDVLRRQLGRAYGMNLN